MWYAYQFRDWIRCDGIRLYILQHRANGRRSQQSRKNCVSLTQYIALTLMNQLQTDENGVHAYFNFRMTSRKSPASKDATAPFKSPP